MKFEDIAENYQGIVEKVAIESGKRMAEDLRRSAPRMLVHQKRLTRGFEARLDDVWGDALDRFEAGKVACWEAGAIFNEEASELARAGEYHPFIVLRAIHARGCLVAAEIFILLKSGYPEGAEARWRTMHELVVVSYLIGSDVDLAQRFVDHALYDAWRDEQAAIQETERAGHEPNRDECERLRAELDECVRRYGAGFDQDWGWARPVFPEISNRGTVTFSMLERQASLSGMRPAYRRSSHFIHGGAGGAALSSVVFRGAPEMRTGPTNAWLAAPAIAALEALQSLTVTFLFNGMPEDAPSPTPLSIASMIALDAIVEDACHAFGVAETRLEDLEARFRSAESRSRLGPVLHRLYQRWMHLRMWWRRTRGVVSGLMS